jgi:hypothetical protein
MKLRDTLDLYTDFLITQNHLATATSCSALIDHKVKHDTFTRALSIRNYNSAYLWKANTKTVTEHSNDEGVLILDNSVIHKSYSKINEIVNYHYDHAVGKSVKGINLLSALVQYGKMSIPIGFELITKDIPCIRKNKKGDEIMSLRSRYTINELARQLVKKASTNNIPYRYILGDSWFSSKENINFFCGEKRKFVLGLPKNRLVALSYQDMKSNNYVNLTTLELKNEESIQIYLKDIKYPLAITYKVFKNEDASTGELFLVTNDLKLSGDCIYSIYQKRWSIETYHKSLKQNASLGKSQTSTKLTQTNHICMALLAFTKLERIINCNKSNHFALKQQLILSANKASYEKFNDIQMELKMAA